MRILSRRHLVGSDGSKNVGSVAALITCFLRDVPGLGEVLSDWLVGISAEGVAQEHATHRAAVAALALDEGLYSINHNSVHILTNH